MSEQPLTTRRIEASDLSESEIRELFDYLLSELQCHSPKMSGESGWRFHTLRNCYGFGRLDAVRNSYAQHLLDLAAASPTTEKRA